MQEKMIVQEILNDEKKNFNKTNNHNSNQQLVGHNDLFRGVIVKQWLMGNQVRIIFFRHNEALAKFFIKCYYECRKRRCVVFHNPEIQTKYLKIESASMWTKKARVFRTNARNSKQ